MAPPPSTATATAAKEKMGARAATTTASSTEASAAAPASVPSGGYDPSRRYRLRRTGVIGSREKVRVKERSALVFV